jgi:hypothetical protein
LNAKLKKALPDTKDIANTDVIRSYLGLLSLGKSDYEAIADMKDDKYFQQSNLLALRLKIFSSVQILGGIRGVSLIQVLGKQSQLNRR